VSAAILHENVLQSSQKRKASQQKVFLHLKKTAISSKARFSIKANSKIQLDKNF